MAASPRLHLAALMIAGPVVHSHALWRNPRHETPFLSAAHYLELGRILEHGKFDLLFFADRLGIADRFGNEKETGLRYGDQDATRLDPLPIISLIAGATRHLGLGATRSTTYDQPFHIAREFRTLDHLSNGRAAWNVVTSMNDGEAQNFGVDEHMEHDERYDRAEEFLELTGKLWDSWETDALVLDRERGIYADPDKVHYVDHQGRYFKSRGPLNIPASPQGRPVIMQAGSSARGKIFAARWAEVIFSLAPDVASMASFTASMRDAVADQGRPPEACRVLPAVMPFVGASEAEAIEKRDLHNSLVNPLVGLTTLAAHANVDLSVYPLDACVNDIESRGTQGNIAHVKRLAKENGMTFADVGRAYGQSVLVPQIVGTGAQIADQLAEIFVSGACDGFVISPAFLPDSFAEFVDEVVPHLQCIGVLRQQYEGRTLRENLAS